MNILVHEDDMNFNYRDFQSWKKTSRDELVDGKYYNIREDITKNHQLVTGEAYRQIKNCIMEKKIDFQVFTFPFEVRFALSNESEQMIKNVVLPDISIIFNEKKIDDTGFRGVPDFIAEVVSPTSVKKDMKVKYYLYEKYGVGEYWIFYPQDKMLMVYELSDYGKYERAKVYRESEIVDIETIPGISVDLEKVFDL